MMPPLLMPVAYTRWASTPTLAPMASTHGGDEADVVDTRRDPGAPQQPPSVFHA